MSAKNSHCTYCGARFAEVAWPRRCVACGNTSFVNPLPVAVVLVPVDDGLLTVRRAIPPRVGSLALPGGFIDLGETWQECAARELYEEAGVRVDPGGIADFCARSAPDGTLLVFGLAPAMRGPDLPPFVASTEASERFVLRAPTELAFPLHSEVVARYFGAKSGRK